MCGINGITIRDKKSIVSMNNLLKHRGPDAQQYKLFPKLSLGHTRLSIIDLSSAGNQPMTKFGYTIVFNGEIYNYIELKQELVKKGYKFSTKTDTEVILAAYDCWKEQCLNKFNGMWAFAIYDPKKEQLFISRDRYGIKPLYYYSDKNKLIFSSEIKPILKMGISKIPNDKVIAKYLYYGITDDTDETFFENIYQLTPGHYINYNFKTKKLKKNKYYKFKTENKKIIEDTAINNLRKLLNDSIKLTYRSDVEVGCCLSGGLDSSTIVGISDKLFHNNKLKTFSAIFPGSKINEEEYIDLVTTQKKVKNFKISPKSIELISDLYDLIYFQEEPFGSTSIYAQYQVMKLVNKNKVKVLIDGQGADEIFMGNYSYYAPYIFQLLKNKKYLTVFGNPLFWRHLFNQTTSNPKRIINKLNSFFLNKSKHTNLFLIKCPQLNFPKTLNEIQKSSMQTSLKSLLKWEDKNAMRFSVESRVPFLDYRLVEFAFNLPEDYKIRDFKTKYLFRKAIADYIPKEILLRKDKIGFATPEKEWFKTELFTDFLNKIINSKSFSNRKYWNANEIRKLANHRNSEFYIYIWRIINLELWLRQFVDENNNDKNLF